MVPLTLVMVTFLRTNQQCYSIPLQRFIRRLYMTTYYFMLPKIWGYSSTVWFKPKGSKLLVVFISLIQIHIFPSICFVISSTTKKTIFLGQMMIEEKKTICFVRKTTPRCNHHVYFLTNRCNHVRYSETCKKFSPTPVNKVQDISYLKFEPRRLR